eukprot:3412328-Karenia_brevis.AAC.1
MPAGCPVLQAIFAATRVDIKPCLNRSGETCDTQFLNIKTTIEASVLQLSNEWPHQFSIDACHMCAVV